jgi:pyruvate formate lyase activating enzyme
LLDWVGLDLKAPEEDYARITGVERSGIGPWNSARTLIASAVDHEIRVTVHQALLDPSQVDGMVDRLRAMGARSITMQPCRTDHALDPSLRGLPAADLGLFGAAEGNDAFARARR